MLSSTRTALRRAVPIPQEPDMTTLFPTLFRPFVPATRRDDFDTWLQRFYEQPFDYWPEAGARGDFVPALNVAEDAKTMTVTVELPGFDEKDIQVNATKNLLTVSGERKWEQEKKGKDWRRVESRYGSFTRTVSLPENLATERIDAIFSKGILTLTIPKVEPTPTTQVKIKPQ
jgi:HSP20 family protein